MLECLILGDSIAYGVHVMMHECQTYSQIGITSSGWNNKWLTYSLDAKTAVISLGSNDNIRSDSKIELNRLRNKIKAERVFWIMPYGVAQGSGISIQQIQAIVKEISRKHGDYVIEIRHVSGDHIHPTTSEYRSIANQIRELSK